LVTKLISAILTALSFSAVYTFMDGRERTVESVFLYDFTYSFYMGSMVLFFFLACIGIPLSVLADYLIARIGLRIKRQRKRNSLMSLPIYTLIGVLFGLIFLTFQPRVTISIASQNILFFVSTGAVFAIYQWLLRSLFSFK